MRLHPTAASSPTRTTRIAAAAAAGEPHDVRRHADEVKLSIQAVLFDADGVIQRPSARRREAWQTLIGPGRDVDAFFSAVLHIEQPAWVGSSDFIEAFSKLIHEWGCQGTLDDALAAWTMIEPDAGMLRAVADLRLQGLGCYLATNQEPCRAAHMSSRLGYRELFDREFYSCRLGIAKPAAAYFNAILDVLGLPAQAVLFLDDHDVNVASARAAGLRAESFLVDSGPTQLAHTLAAFGVHVV